MGWPVRETSYRYPSLHLDEYQRAVGRLRLDVVSQPLRRAHICGLLTQRPLLRHDRFHGDELDTLPRLHVGAVVGRDRRSPLELLDESTRDHQRSTSHLGGSRNDVALFLELVETELHAIGERVGPLPSLQVLRPAVPVGDLPGEP